ncbi:MAG TPA: NAD(P)H-hydrate dehydratase [Mesotoga sp.]|nr:NAD(P)H-hydrate dehydratase [Mesotoga sp.]
MKVAFPAQMREIDQRIIDKGVPSLLLMEEAARSVYEEIADLNIRKAAILCGGGNNGGDGYAAARLMHAAGIDVTVVQCYAPTTDDCKTNATIYVSLGGKGVKLEEESIVGDLLAGSDMVVDAIFGTGFHGSLEEKILSLFEYVNRLDAYRLAVDIPSGVSGYNGSVSRNCFKADKTVTFGLAKTGHFLYPGREFCGKVVVSSAGFHRSIMDSLADSEVIDDEMASELLPERARNSYKGSYGSVLVVGGSEVYTGAPFLAAIGAFRSGCGLVYTYTPKGSANVIRNNLPEAIAMISSGDTLVPRDVDYLSEAIDKIDSIVLGPGIGRSEGSIEFVLKFLKSFPEKKFVVDADALFALVNDLSILGRSQNVLITPHIGEFARLNEGRTDLASFIEFCSRLSMNAILKGASSVFCNENGRIIINTAGSTALAKAGSGDLLAGTIAGFAAQTGDLERSGVLGMYLMGRAAELSDLCEPCNSASKISESYSLVFEHLRKMERRLHGTRP